MRSAEECFVTLLARMCSPEHAERITGAVIGAAVRSGVPSLVLRRTEWFRTVIPRRRRLPPPSDRNLRTALSALRETVGGHGSRSAVPATVGALEDRVRRQAVRGGGNRAEAVRKFELDEVLSELGKAVLLNYFVHDGRMYSTVVVDGEVRLGEHGDGVVESGEIDRLRYFLGKQSVRTDPHSAEMFSAGARESARALDRWLLEPVERELDRGRSLVVVPTGPLHALPWAALPRCRGRSVTVAPSLRCWLGAAARERSATAGSSGVWVGGPDLEHAVGEVRTLHAVSGGRLLLGGAATVDRVLESMDGAEFAHIAAHGWFRGDHPLLSCLELADGPLYGYDVHRLRRGPTTVVLSACEVGCFATGRGNELTGMAAALLERGTATLIAGAVPISDERAARVMVSLHAGLRRGLAPAEALASAQAMHGEHGFVCLGHGGT